jgi:hypothetical protein
MPAAPERDWQLFRLASDYKRLPESVSVISRPVPELLFDEKERGVRGAGRSAFDHVAGALQMRLDHSVIFHPVCVASSKQLYLYACH